MFEAIRGCIMPRFSLHACLAAWPAVVERLKERPRQRRLQSAEMKDVLFG